MPTDPDRRIGLLQRLGIKCETVELEVLAVIGGFVAGPQLDHRLDHLVADLAAVGVVPAHDGELAAQIADAQPRDGPAAGEPVQRRDHFRQLDRVVIAEHDHGVDQTDAPRRPGEDAQRHQRVRPARSHDGDHLFEHDGVLGNAEKIEAEVVGLPRHAQHIVGGRLGGPGLGGARLQRDTGNRDSDLHGTLPRRLAAP